eukprot:198485-Pyramimonas_sp.AAC.1
MATITGGVPRRRSETAGASAHATSGCASWHTHWYATTASSKDPSPGGAPPAEPSQPTSTACALVPWKANALTPTTPVVIAPALAPHS